MKSLFGIFLSCFLLGCSSSVTNDTDGRVHDDLKNKYLTACVKEKPKLGKQKCNCFFESAKKEMNRLELEYMTVLLEKNTYRKNEIEKNPDFDKKSYYQTSSKVLSHSIECISNL